MQQEKQCVKEHLRGKRSHPVKCQHKTQLNGQPTVGRRCEIPVAHVYASGIKHKDQATCGKMGLTPEKRVGTLNRVLRNLKDAKSCDGGEGSSETGAGGKADGFREKTECLVNTLAWNVTNYVMAKPGEGSAGDKLCQVWRYAKITQRRKLELFNACVISKLTYNRHAIWLKSAEFCLW